MKKYKTLLLVTAVFVVLSAIATASNDRRARGQWGEPEGSFLTRLWIFLTHPNLTINVLTDSDYIAQ